MKTDINILILEDNPDDLLLFEEALQSSLEKESNIHHAETLEGAMDKANENALDLAILDLNVPDSFGLDTFLTFNKDFAHIPCIIMTGIDDLDMALSAIKNGAQDYIQKGTLSSTDIAKTVRYSMERHHLLAELSKTQSELKNALNDAIIREKEISGLLKGARAVLEQSDFETTARRLFDTCSQLIGVTSGYIALLSKDGSENDVLFLEAGGLPCTVDPELPMPIRGLRAEAYHSNKAVYHNDFMNSEWVDFMPKGHVILKNVMFAPLVINEKTVGVIGLANKAIDFNDNDAKMATGFGELAAIALQNSRNLDERITAEQQREKVIIDLKKALSEVKKLSGLLPICSHCKKIRDDKGYWRQIESYIHEHSEAEFSHSICKECAEKYYSNFDLYGED
jgi:DNA-binding NarL/FixJ family response regulator